MENCPAHYALALAHGRAEAVCAILKKPHPHHQPPPAQNGDRRLRQRSLGASHNQRFPADKIAPAAERLALPPGPRLAASAKMRAVLFSNTEPYQLAYLQNERKRVALRVWA